MVCLGILPSIDENDFYIHVYVQGQDGEVVKATMCACVGFVSHPETNLKTQISAISINVVVVFSASSKITKLYVWGLQVLSLKLSITSERK